MRLLNPADRETARFGLNVARASLDAIDAGALARELIDDRVDVAILRLPVRPDTGVAALHALGLGPIHADTLVTYACDLARYTPQAPHNASLDIRAAGPGDVAGILDLVQVVFAEYPSHYSANPLLPRAGMLAGYGEWALSHMGASDRTCWVACVDGRVAGLACSAFDATTGVCQGVLHGVSPDFARNRIYTDLIRYTQRYFRDRGLGKLEISTQVGNLRVQRVWVREGFTFESAVDTFHVNALFGAVAASQQPLAIRAPASGGAGAGWLCAELMKLVEADPRRARELTNCQASMLTEIVPGAEYRAGFGWAPPRPGLAGGHGVFVVRDLGDVPVAWASARQRAGSAP
jgi:hypothetical protein